jgi:amidase
MDASEAASAFCAHATTFRGGSPGGPLAGRRFAVKDLFAIAGHRACFGNPDWLSTHWAAEATAPVITWLLDAGAALVGTTVTDELAFSLTGENPHYGTPPNPAAPGRVPGGSSSGSASAVAGGLVDFALGTDTGGSVRVPASHCGIFGFRPTHGAVSPAGVLPFSPSFDTVGWFARDADTLAAVGDRLFPATRDRGRRRAGGCSPTPSIWCTRRRAGRCARERSV